jgi:molybdenum-dependent DNA-binding transcriptional regulator ModE
MIGLSNVREIILMVSPIEYRKMIASASRPPSKRGCRAQRKKNTTGIVRDYLAIFGDWQPPPEWDWTNTFRAFRMMILDNLALFLRIVEKGGLAAAGREVGLSAASVSERLVALEKYYGAALLHRTTRAISLTDEGRLLVQGARRLLAEADELEALIRLGVEKISGPIRLSAPIDLGRSYLVPILDAFLAEHPEVTIDLNLTDGYVDLVGQGQDLAIRYGELADSTLRVKRLVENRRIVCASPAYLETRGAPQHPGDLVHHECLVMRYGLTTDRDWPTTGLQIVYPATQAQPRRVRLLIERIAEAFSSSDARSV